jgi:hypothetical protein
MDYDHRNRNETICPFPRIQNTTNFVSTAFHIKNASVTNNSTNVAISHPGAFAQMPTAQVMIAKLTKVNITAERQSACWTGKMDDILVS